MASNLSLGIIVGASVNGSVGRAFQSIDASATRLGRNLNQVRLGRAASEDVIRYRTQLDNLNTAQRQFGVGNTRLFGQIADTERALRTASQTAERYGLNIGDITRENHRLLQSEQRIAGQLQRSNILRANRDRRSELGGQIVGTVGLAFAAAAPIKAAMEFETVMADVRKVVDMTDTEMKGLGKSILDMSANMPMAAAGIGAIVAAAGQSGIAKNELLGFAQAAVKMGVAFDLSGDEAGQTMASWRAGMSISQKQAESLADSVNYLSSKMNASAKDISAVITRQGAVAKAAGLSEIQIAALSAALLNSGAAPEIAATALKNLTNALTRGDSATKAQRKSLDALGLTSKQVTAGMQKDAEGTIKMVFDKLSKASAENRGALVGNLFGEEAKGAIMPLLINLDALKSAYESVGDASKYAGSMDKEYQIRANTKKNAMELMNNQMTRLGVNLGSVLLPALNNVFGVISTGAGYISGLAEKFPMATQAVVGLTVGLVALKVVTLATGYATTLVSDAWVMARATMAFFTMGTMQANAALAMQRIAVVGATIAQGAMAAWTGTVTAAQWLWNAAVLAFPIVAAVAGVVALGAAAVWVYKNWETVTAKFNEMFPAIGAAISGASAAVRAAWESTFAWFQEKFAWLGAAMSSVAGFASSIGGAVSSVGKFMTTPIGAAEQSGSRGSLGDLVRSGSNAALPAVASAKSGGATHNTTHATIHVTQKPGEDQDSFVDRIMTKIQRREQATARGALHD